MGLTSPRDSYFWVKWFWMVCRRNCRASLGLDGSLRLRSGQAPTRPYTVRGPFQFDLVPSRSKPSYTFPTRLGALLNLQLFCCSQVSAVDRVCGGYFGDCIGVQVVGSEGQVFSERNFELVGVLLQGEMLIADRGGASDWIHG